MLYITTVVRRREEHNKDQRELRGLTRILDAEIQRNRERLIDPAHPEEAKFGNFQPDALEAFKILSRELEHLESDDWNRSKVRLAQLATDEHFAALNAYYSRLPEALRLGQRENISPFDLVEGPQLTQECIALGDSAIALGETAQAPPAGPTGG